MKHKILLGNTALDSFFLPFIAYVVDADIGSWTAGNKQVAFIPRL